MDSIDVWLIRQIEEGVSWGGWLGNLILGGVNLHIEHHVCPALTPTYYYRLRPLLESICKKHGVTYTYEKTFFGACKRLSISPFFNVLFNGCKLLILTVCIVSWPKVLSFFYIEIKFLTLLVLNVGTTRISRRWGKKVLQSRVKNIIDIIDGDSRIFTILVNSQNLLKNDVK